MTREEPACRTWADHDFGTFRLVATGAQPVRGQYQRFRAACRRCGNGIEETRWLGRAPGWPALDAMQLDT